MELKDPAKLAALIGFDVSELDAQLLGRLHDALGEYPWWRRSIEFPPSRYVNGQLVSELMVMRTRYFIDLSEARKVRGDLMIMAAAYMYTGSASAAGGLALAKKAMDTISRLTDDEAEMVRVIMSKAGRNPYEGAVSQEAIGISYVDALIDPGVLLDALEERGVVKRDTAGNVRLVR